MAKRSPIWDYFTVNEDAHYAVCNVCQISISRGGKNTKTFNTTNIVQHLKSKHIDEFKKYQRAQAGKIAEQQTNSTKQLTLEAAEDRVKLWNCSDPQAQRITHRIGEMVALDCQPLSIVEDTGFLRLMKEMEPIARYVVPSRKYITDVILPQIMNGVATEVKKELSSAQWYSFTTDTVQSNYNFTLTRVITRVHAWLHGKSCRGPRCMAACATATALSHVSMRGNHSYTAISAVVAACPIINLMRRVFTEIIYTCTC